MSLKFHGIAIVMMVMSTRKIITEKKYGSSRKSRTFAPSKHRKFQKLKDNKPSRRAARQHTWRACFILGGSGIFVRDRLFLAYGSKCRSLMHSFSVALFDIVYFLVFVFVSNFLFSERTVLLFVIHILVDSIILQIRHYLSRELG